MEYKVLSNILVLALLGVSPTSGFVATPSPPSTRLRAGTFVAEQRSLYQPVGDLFRGEYDSCKPQRQSISHLSAVIDSSSLLVSVESWRQYVPLVISFGIIIDIVLGNPLANAVLKPMRPEEGKDNEEKNDNKPRSRARVDAELIAQQALDKANNTLELRNFLEERKTDYDRMEEMKRKLDSTMQDMDEDMEARQKSIDERRAQ
mmetsp:Transcript_25653/g.56256  ORF Transcript_25653/g.56256 Transcript_25653/m.56256 type:complete len:204 (-) Transcript_25653:168-779(-)